MAAPATAERIREVNQRYHDVAARDYDAKWGIDFGPAGQAQVVGKLRKALGCDPGRFPRALEIGAGTGYFSLNLAQRGVVDEVTAVDISPGMLATLEANAARLGIPVTTATCEAAELPFEDASFDLVLGHAVLHHLPDLEGSFREFRRVLRPGGTLAFAGEPSRTGDRIASYPKRAAYRLSPIWRAALRAAPRPPEGEDDHEHAEHQLEHVVDVHAFTPGDLVRVTEAAGFADVRASGEELLANWFGWTNRALEATAAPEDVPGWWRQYAYRGYLALQAVDQRLLEGRLPADLFYNLLLSARKPAS